MELVPCSGLLAVDKIKKHLLGLTLPNAVSAALIFLPELRSILNHVNRDYEYNIIS